MSRDVLAHIPSLHYVAYRAGFTCMPFIPLRLGYLLAWVVGYLVYAIDATGRKQVAANLRGVARKRHLSLPWLVRRNYFRFLQSVCDGMRMHRLPHRMAERQHLRITDPWNQMRHRPMRGPPSSSRWPTTSGEPPNM